MIGYTKLFGSILDSTVWLEDAPTRLVWVTMMAMADRNGLVEAAVPGLAVRARVTLPECEAALVKFLAPDPYSRSEEYEGRRIEKVDGGWRLLNHQKYRDRLDLEQRRAAATERKRRERDRHALSRSVTPVTPPVAQCHDKAEATTEAEAEAKPEQVVSAGDKLQPKRDSGELSRTRARATRGTRLPEDWTPKALTAEQRKTVTLTDAQIGEELPNFKDHFAGAAGAKGIHADWDATWRNWLRRAPEFASGVHRIAPKSNGARSETFQRQMDRVRQLELEEELSLERKALP